MEINEIESAIEAMLFACGEPISAAKLADSAAIDKASCEKILQALTDRYNYERRGITVLKLGELYQMSTRQEYCEYVKRAIEHRKDTILSGASLEVLAIVAYNQPVTKGYIEQIRGVDSSSVVNTLVEKGLVEDRGKLDVPGHPRLYGTTPDFMRCFGISSIAELPPLEDLLQQHDPVLI